MGRRPSPLRREALEPTLRYIRRALDREAAVFAKPHRLTAVAYTSLIAKGGTTKRGDYLPMVNAWVDTYMTAEGRSAMLAALRRRRADAATTTQPSRVLRVKATTYEELRHLAVELDLPMATALSALVRAAASDAQLRGTVQRLVPMPRR